MRGLQIQFTNFKYFIPLFGPYGKDFLIAVKPSFSPTPVLVRKY